MIYLYNLIFYQPILNLLIFFYNTIALGDLGLAIIFSTVLIRLILFPIFHKSAENQLIMAKLQPKIKKIKEEHKRDWEKQSRALMAVYKEHKVNPYSGFLLLLIQVPILIALYRIFFNIFSPEIFKNLYAFMIAPGSINPWFLGLINLKDKSMIMVALAAAAQYFQGWVALPKVENGRELSKEERLSRRMVLLGPAITFVVFLGFPSAVGLYWFTTSIFSVFQQVIINRKLANGKLGDLH